MLRERIREPLRGEGGRGRMSERGRGRGGVVMNVVVFVALLIVTSTQRWVLCGNSFLPGRW